MNFAGELPNDVPAPASGVTMNLISAFETTAAHFRERTAAKSKRLGTWQTLSWTAMAERVRHLADGFVVMGVQAGDRVAILADTHLEWILTYLGVLAARAIAVPIYQSNKAAECRYVLQDSGALWVAIDSDAQRDKLRSVLPTLPKIKGVLCMHVEATDTLEHSLTALEDLGRSYRQTNPTAYETRVRDIACDDLACLLYTSGTTGNPKGVMLTHANWVFQAKGVRTNNLINEDDTILLFLPLAHSFAQVVVAAWLYLGCIVVFPEAVDKLIDNAAETGPTLVPAVPRIFEKAFANVVQKGLSQSGIKGYLFKMALSAVDDYAAARERGQSYSSLAFFLSKALVYPKLAAALRERFGGRLRLFVSGGAPLSPKIGYFFDILGILILEGYGLSETSAAVSVNLPTKNKIGTVGPPFPGTEVVIADDGEILVRGGSVMKGYWNNPAASAEALHNGYFATGDIGLCDSDGYLKITDRKKDIIVTAAGKNVAPQNIENELKAHSLISQVMVHGDKRKFLSAIITLNEDSVRQWAASCGLPSLSLPELTRHPALIAHVQQLVDGVNSKQASYAGIKRFAILPVDFTIETGELTPTLKVKRKFCGEKYSDVLDRMYRE